MDDLTPPDDADIFGDMPFSADEAREVLANPTWSYLLFETTIIWNEITEQEDRNPLFDAGVTPKELSNRLPFEVENLDDKIEALADLGVLQVESQSGSLKFKSSGCKLMPSKGIELPDGAVVEHLPPLTFGTVGYAHTDDAVANVLDEHGHGLFDNAAKLYHRIVIEDDPEFSLEEMFPDVDDADVRVLRPALEYSHRRLSEDPIWGIEYLTDEESG